ncbi:hypothetical protein LINGRAHAP2_LOCUS33844 [Linum grandiflorum]
MLGVGAVPSIILGVSFLPRMPESPQWLVVQCRLAGCRSSSKSAAPQTKPRIDSKKSKNPPEFIQKTRTRNLCRKNYSSAPPTPCSTFYCA